MPRKIRIAHIVTGLVFGGVGQALWTIAKKIDRARFELDFYCVIEGGDLVPEIERLGSRVAVLEGAYDYRKILPYRLSHIRRLIRELKRGRYDIVHTHLYQADVIGRIAAIIAGVPTIVKSLHNMGEWKTGRHLMIDRILARWTDRVICCSAYQREAAVTQEGLAADHAVTIYHGVDVDRFQAPEHRAALIKELGLNPNWKTVGTVGRLIEAKGHCDLLAAIPAVLSRHPATQFLIVGDGPLREQLTNSLRGTSYEDRVIWPGLRGDIPQLLALMDVFVFPSLTEGLGIAVLEAMAAGLPVVASDIRPLTEIVQDGLTGLLVRPRDPEAVASAVNRMLTDDGLRTMLARSGRELVRQRFSDTTMVSEHQDLYQTLYEQRQSLAA